ncbi:Cyclic nucleotide-gated cation channel [Trichinella patagoniensis]|uniref:Cyclic nucleotide-gated cation channel n=1 Tax=Trichinella patagoniensis TaxID=990121 RepID=A0A0V1A964_9BILA|nr:Cyclic nucleotide-gated cation channel [Trichinella patagoniensis]
MRDEEREARRNGEEVDDDFYGNGSQCTEWQTHFSTKNFSFKIILNLVHMSDKAMWNSASDTGWCPDKSEDEIIQLSSISGELDEKSNFHKENLFDKFCRSQRLKWILLCSEQKCTNVSGSMLCVDGDCSNWNSADRFVNAETPMQAPCQGRGQRASLPLTLSTFVPNTTKQTPKSQSLDRLINWRTKKPFSTENVQDDDFIRKFAVGYTATAYADDIHRKGFLGWLESKVVLPYGNAYYYWTAVVTVAVAYNVITILLRAVFDEYQHPYYIMWLVLDYCCDLIYICDMLVKFRTGYLEHGLMVRDLRKLALNYVKRLRFVLDVVSILPTDIFYIYLQNVNNPIVRLNRVFKLPSVFDFAEKTESRTSWPNAFRLFCLIACILTIIHINGCLYFAVSEAMGLGSDQWVYNDNNLTDSFSRRYFYSFYWSTLTLTTIGETPYPEKDEEILFNTVDYLIGVLIFATLVGNIGSMIANMNAARTEFQARMDAIKQFMESHRVERELQRRVIAWYDYQWTNKTNLNSDAALATLPPKLRAEIAIHVHFKTLRKVTIFQDCEAGLLVELVLRLRRQVFSPSDYICRKGDVGKEMYIVKEGKLSVVSDDALTVYATLAEGAVFGELSILNIAGNKNGNRRTANIRSVGYSDLFTLSKDDLWNVLKYYPEAKKLLINKGKEILRKDNLLDETVEDEQEQADRLADSFQARLQALKDRYETVIGRYEEMHRRMNRRIAFLESKLDRRYCQDTTV